MATPPVLDFAHLLKPISDDQPAGPELRTADGAAQIAYYAVRDARKKAGDAERRLRMYELLSPEEKDLEPATPEPADWETVQDLTLSALDKSRDLWVVAWLIESLVRLHGFAGLRDGFRLASEMCKRFWDHIHPRPGAGENLSTTFAQLAGLNGVDSEGTLIAPLKSVPVTGVSNSRAFSCADYLDAVDLERKDPLIRAQRIQNGAPSTDLIDRAVNETDVEFFRNLVEDIQQAMEAFNEFNTWLSAKMADVPEGAAALPPSSSIRDTLAECLRLVKVIARNVLDTGDDETGMTVVSDGQSGGVAASRVQTREEAFRALLQVSDYFRRAEPHSPVSYALEQVVRWGRMSLPELLAELVEDQSSRREIYKRTGIPQPPPHE